MYFKSVFPGYLCVQIKGKNCQKLISMCAYHKVNLWDVVCCEDSYTFKIPWNQYDTVLPLCEKTDSDISIKSKNGFLLLWLRIRQHLSYFTGLKFAIMLIFFLSRHIWDIQVIDNIYYDSTTIIDYLETINITPGMNKNKISCIELADQVRQQFPKIKWASVELVGSNLIVHIKENLTVDDTDTKDDLENVSKQPMHIVSDKDGIVKEIFVRAGIAKVAEGDTCSKGDILVEGQIPIYNDSQEIVKYENVEADADILLQHDYYYFQEIDRTVSDKRLVEVSEKDYVQILDYRFSFPEWKKGKKNVVAEYLDDYTQFKITPTLVFPIYFGRNKIYKYEEKEKILTTDDTKALLEEEFLYFCDELTKKGVQIYQNNVKMEISDAKGVASGKVTVYEKIGAKKSFTPKVVEDSTIQEE